MREVSVGNNLTANTKTTVYTVPTGYYARWNLSYVVNNSGINKTVDVIWYDKSQNTEIYVVHGYILTITQFLKFDSPSAVILEEGDEVRIKTELGSDMSAINTFELIRK